MTIPTMTPGQKNKTGARQFSKDMTLDVLARTLWGEARGEGETGMRAVANVILNRVEVAGLFGGYWWGNDVLRVCLKPYQFSCWNKNDPNYTKLLGVTEDNPVFALALDIANSALRGQLQDITQGATHYHTQQINPAWASRRDPCARIGAHIFYRIVEEEDALS